MPKPSEQRLETATDAELSSRAFGEVLREYRIEAGISQERLAERARISVTAVGALERGVRRAPYRRTVSLLAEALALGETDRALLEASAAKVRRRGYAAPLRVDFTDYFPTHRTSFIGRDEEMATASELLRKARLVTLSGGGGVGKTRLALEVAKRALEKTGREAWFVDLAPLADGRYIAGKIASAIRSLPASGAETIAKLAQAISDRSMLLVLDNCEHIASAAATAASELLKSCPNVKVLATSRAPLLVDGEVVLRLPSLQPADSEQLFTQRAQAAGAVTELTIESRRTVAAVCRRLDDIPLAIELAAARLPILGLRTLHDRLDDLFAVPLMQHDTSPRHQTMLATIAWSYDLLGKAERELLSSLAIFAGGFTLEAAESVGGGGSFKSSSILYLLSSLVDKSLVNAVQTAYSARYRLLHAVRSYGLDELSASGRLAEVSRRHAEWFAQIADRVEARTQMQYEMFVELLPEVDNVRAAIAWSLDASSPEDYALAGRLIAGMRTPWLMIGRLDEHRRWIETVLERIEESRHPRVVACLLHALIQNTWAEPTVARTIERARRLYEAIGDPRASVTLYTTLIFVQAGRGKLAEAEESSERALALLTSERLLRSHQYALYLRNRSLLRELQGRLDDAKADISAAEELAEFLGDRYFVIARCLPRLYDIEYRLGNVDGAVALIEEMLSSEFGQMPEIAINGLESLTTLRLLQGDIVRAVAAVRQLLVITRGPTTVWRHIAAAVALQGHVHLAARLLGFVDATPPEIWATDPIEQRSYDLLRTAVCERLPSHIVEDRRAEGKQMTPQDASKEVLAVLT